MKILSVLLFHLKFYSSKFRPLKKAYQPDVYLLQMFEMDYQWIRGVCQDEQFEESPTVNIILIRLSSSHLEITRVYLHSYLAISIH